MATNIDKTILDLERKIVKLESHLPNVDEIFQLKLAKTYQEYAEIRFRQSQYTESKKYYLKARELYKLLNDYQGQIACKNADASISLAKGDLFAARLSLEQLSDQLKEKPNKNYQHIVLNNLGVVYDKLGNLARAVLFYQRSIALKKELDIPIKPTYTLHNLANIYYQVEDYKSAGKYHKLALVSLADSDDLNAKATIYNGIAQTQTKKRQYKKAKKNFIRAKKLASSINIRAQIAESLIGLGHLKFLQKEFKNAEKLINRSLKTFTELEEQEYMVKCLIDLAEINCHQKIKKADSQIKRARKLCKLNGFQLLLAITYKVSAKIKEKQNKYKKAIAFNKKYLALYIETNKINILNQAEVNRLTIELENAKNQTSEIKKQAKDLEHDSTHDHLTGSFNRRQLDRTLSENWKQKSVQKHPNFLAMLDIDDFKWVNDNFSHQIGDKVLQKISKIINTNLNKNDRLFRYGGEEFIIYLNNKNFTQAKLGFEKIRTAIEKNNWHRISSGLKVTVTQGMVSSDEQKNIKSALQLADQRMYKGKKSGKNTLIYN